MKCKTLKQHELKSEANRIKLRREINNLLMSGNKLRSDALISRYNKRYGYSGKILRAEVNV